VTNFLVLKLLAVGTPMLLMGDAQSMAERVDGKFVGAFIRAVKLPLTSARKRTLPGFEAAQPG